MNPPLVIRADASAQIGAGHVMRCLALAETWLLADGAVHLVSAELPEAFRARAESLGVNVVNLKSAPGSSEDAEELVAFATAQKNTQWIALDGYHFDAAFQKHIKSAGLKLLAIDDTGHAEHYSADLVLNQNLGARGSLYPSRERETRLLFGPRNALLRRDFTRGKFQRQEFPETATNILVTLDGSDPDNATAQVIKALQLLASQDISGTIVVGGSNPHFDALRDQVGRCSARLSLVHNADNMPELMAAADIAIAAAGSTTWELACLGVPGIVGVLADNQESNAAKLDAAGAFISAGWYRDISPERLAEMVDKLLRSRERRVAMSAAGRRLVDGLGGLRLWPQMNAKLLRLATNTQADCAGVWKRANDPEVRAVSFTSKAIPWDDHLKWYAATLRDSGSRMFIAEDASGRAVGHVRFQLGGESAVISIVVDAAVRGRNWGALMIRESCATLFQKVQRLNTIVALIRPENAASIRVFAKAEFVPTGETECNGHAALRFELSRDKFML